MVSACIPSLMPLFLLIVGKRRPTRGSELYTKYGSGSDDKKRSESRFNRMLSVNDATRLPEALELPNRSQNALDENDNAHLVPSGTIKPGAIIITNQIDQVSVPEHAQFGPLHGQGHAAELSWAAHPPSSISTR